MTDKVKKAPKAKKVTTAEVPVVSKAFSVVALSGESMLNGKLLVGTSPVVVTEELQSDAKFMRHLNYALSIGSLQKV